MTEEKGKPLTREDVLRLIKENGGTAKGLDLSRRVFVTGIDLSELDLNGVDLGSAHLEEAHLGFAHLEGARLKDAYLKEAKLWETHFENANLGSAHLEGANLMRAHLEGAELVEAHFEKAFLRSAHLEGADFSSACLEGAYLHGTHFWVDTRLEAVDWGDYILGEEKSRQFDKAVNAYQQLKQWHTTAGLYNIAARFYYREKEAARKGAKRRWDRAAGWLSWAVFGHGEGWKRILIWMVGFILLFALTYCAIGSIWDWSAFGNSLYFSAVSFTALGYGSWVEITNNWIKGIGAFESLVGVSMIALLLVTFFRKWTR